MCIFNLSDVSHISRYGDGAVRLFDARLPPDRNAVASWHEHQAWVVNAHLSGHYGAVSASADGSIDFFDLRASGAVGGLGKCRYRGWNIYGVVEENSVWIVTGGRRLRK